MKPTEQPQVNPNAILPYPPSFIDRFFRFIQQLPVPYWLTYLLLFSLFFGSIESIEELEAIENFDNIGIVLSGLMFFLLISMFVLFCTFYQYWFIAKTIKSAQLQKDAVFGEFVGEFFLLWFYPIGIWILQPMVNKLVQEGVKE